MSTNLNCKSVDLEDLNDGKYVKQGVFVGEKSA